MLILAIESSSTICSLALVQRGKVLADWYVHSGRTHSSGIMSQLEGLLKRCMLDKKSVKAVAVNVGPGSFTGLRIGLSLAKALSISLDIPILGVDSGDVLAYNGKFIDGYVVTLIDAQRNNFYCTVYRCQSTFVTKLEETCVLSIEKIVEKIENLTGPVTLYGDYRSEVFFNICKEKILPEHLRMPRASSLGLIAEQKLQEGLTSSPYTLAINYIKPSEAEIVWESKQHVSN